MCLAHSPQLFVVPRPARFRRNRQPFSANLLTRPYSAVFDFSYRLKQLESTYILMACTWPLSSRTKFARTVTDVDTDDRCSDRARALRPPWPAGAKRVCALAVAFTGHRTNRHWHGHCPSVSPRGVSCVGCDGGSPTHDRERVRNAPEGSDAFHESFACVRA